MLLLRLCAATALTGYVFASASSNTTGVLLPGQRLSPGQSITAGDGFLVMQLNGDLAVCAHLDAASTSCGSPALWSSGTAGNVGAYAEMQEMGVLAVCPKGYPGVCHDTDCRLWQSHTMAKAGCENNSTGCAFVEMQKDGNCVIYTGASPLAPGNHAPIWFTGTKILPPNAKNVLWMIADDMRPDMNVAYGQTHMITPAFDRLAKLR